MHDRRLTRIARFAIAALVAALALGASTASARGIQTGFLDPGTISRGGSFEIDPTLAMKTTADDAGGKIVRLYLYWRRVAPPGSSEPDHPSDEATYAWTSDLQDSIDAALAQNLKVMLTIRSAPTYAQRGTPDSRGTHDPDPKMLAHFTHAATQHFLGEVFLWGVWNEPNLHTFLSPQHKNGKLYSPILYRALLKKAAPVIYAADSKNRVVAGETAPFGNKDTSPLTFLRKLLCMQGRSSPQPTKCNPRVKADFWAVHPYTSGNVWHHAYDPDDVSFGDLPQWKKLVRGAVRAGHLRTKSGGKGVGYWITEFSWDTKPPDPTAVPSALHARWTSEALYRAWQLGFGVLLWGQLRDYPISTDPTYGQYQSGLYYCQPRPKPCVGDGSGSDADNPLFDPPASTTAKPSLTAYRFPFVAYAGGGHIRVWGRTPDSAARTVVIERKTSHGWKKLTTASAKGGGVFTKRFSSSLTKGYLRATTAPETHSWKFSLVRPKDRFVNPFGCGGPTPCP